MSEPYDGSGPRPEAEVGSLAEEAAKLVGALGEWAGEHVRDLDEHLATGSQECRLCPVCRTVHAVRSASPEVRAQARSAAQSLIQVGLGLLAAYSHDPASPAVQRIDLDPDDHEAPEEDRP